MKKQSLNQFDEYHVVLRDKDENGHRNSNYKIGVTSLLLYYSNYEGLIISKSNDFIFCK